MKYRYRLNIIIVTTIIVVAIDQATKYWAWLTLRGTQPQSYFDGILRLSFHENPGAFLSLGAEWPQPVRTAVFIGLTSLFLIYLLYYLLTDDLLSRMSVLFGSMMFAGGIGNLIDRIFFENGVIDFLYIGYGWLRTGIFNVADMGVMIGVFGIFIFGLPSAENHPDYSDADSEDIETVPEELIEAERQPNDTSRTIEPEN